MGLMQQHFPKFLLYFPLCFCIKRKKYEESTLYATNILIVQIYFYPGVLKVGSHSIVNEKHVANSL